MNYSGGVPAHVSRVTFKDGTTYQAADILTVFMDVIKLPPGMAVLEYIVVDSRSYLLCTGLMTPAGREIGVEASYSDAYDLPEMVGRLATAMLRALP